MTVSVRAQDVRPLIVFDDYPPYHYWDGQTPAGLNIDILTEAFKRMGVTPKYERYAWKRSLHEVEFGGVTALCAGMKSSERERFAIYPDHSLSLETNWVVSLANRDLAITDLESLRGYSVGVVDSYLYSPEFDAMQGLDKHSSKTDTLLLEKLLSGRVAVIVGNDLVLKHLASKKGAEGQLRFLFKLHSEPLYLIFSKVREENPALAKALSRAIGELRDDGTLKNIRSRY